GHGARRPRHRPPGSWHRAAARHRKHVHRHLLGVGERYPAAVSDRGGRSRPAGLRLHRRHLPGRQRAGPDPGGWLADRGDHPKWVAFFGYGLSAITRLALIPAAGLASITTVITVDRLGKGVRTAPRDALITAASDPDSLGRAFGVHRALDTLGAVIGPLLAFAILQAVAGHSPQLADFHAIFVISFAAAVIGLAVLLLVVPDIRPRRQAQVPSQPAARPTLALLADRRFALLILATTVLGVLTVGDGFVYLALQKRDDLAINYSRC